MNEELQLRLHGDASLPTLIYLPGLHGDWTLIPSFRLALAGRVRFVEFTYPRTLTWSLDDYADAIEAALLEQGITRGWLLGESFGSQIVWPLLAHSSAGRVPQGPALEGGSQSGTRGARPPESSGGRGSSRAPFDPGGRGTPPSQAVFRANGVILAGGFVKHPLKWGVYAAGKFCHGVSLTWLTRLLFFYAKFARFRHRQASETLASIQEFVARRTELDKQAAVHRLRLVAANDPRGLARQVRLPVYQLSGLFDPVVPWPFVRPWLKRHCPGYRGSRVIGMADHNVLGTAPKGAAEQVMQWLQGARLANQSGGEPQVKPELGSWNG